MAVSDLVFSLLAIPVYLAAVVTSSWQVPISGITGLVFCKVKGFVENVSLTVSMESLVWIALDRFVALVSPIRVHLISSRSRFVAIASTWFVAMTVNSPDLFVYRVFEENEKVIYTNFEDVSHAYMIYARVYTAVFEIVPFIVVTVLYSSMAVTITRQDKVLRCTFTSASERSEKTASD